MQKVLKGLFRKSKDEEFIALMQAALEDETIRRQLLTLLALPQPQRLLLLQKWGMELQEEHAPLAQISAIEFLEDEDIATRALQLLHN